MAATDMTSEQEHLLALDRAAMEATALAFESGKAPKPNRWAHRAVGVILAGGRARRMNGKDKPLIEIAGKSMLDHVRTRLSPQVGQMVLSANGDLARFTPELPIISDDIADFAGPLAGILAGMRWAQSHAPEAFWVISAAVDTPFFPHDLTDRLVMAMGGPEPAIVLAQTGEQVHPTFGLWPIVLADDLESYLKSGERKMQLWAARHINSRAIFPGIAIDDLSIDPFFNVNCPDDLDVADAIAAELELPMQIAGTTGPK